jgi:hypothetical protein
MGALERLLFTILDNLRKQSLRTNFSATITNDLCRLWFPDNRIVSFYQWDGFATKSLIHLSRFPHR